MGKTFFSKTNEKSLHPKLQANCLSNLFFCWTFPSLIKGFTTGFEKCDIFEPLPNHEATLLGDELEQEWTDQLLSKHKPSLWKALYKIFGSKFLTVGIIIFINEFIVKLSQPVLIWKLITTHIIGSHKEREAYIYACLIVTSSFINVILSNWYIFKLRDLAIKIRVACTSLIYRKSLKLSRNSSNKTATGQIVNLLSNDLNRFDRLFLQLHYLWAAPLESIVVLYLLYVMLDLTATAGIAVFFIFVPIQIIMGKQYSKFRLKTALKTDERVRLINEIVSGIQIIKMYTWEKLFAKFTDSLRRQEIRYIRCNFYLKTIQNALNKFISKAAVFLCILVFVLTGHHLKSQYVFVIKSFYNLLKQSMTTEFPEAIKNIAEASVSLRRIEDFLLADEKKSGKTPVMKTQTGVVLTEATAKWSSSTCNTLSQINFEAACRELVTVIGAVGSGKTSLINVILQELSLKKGNLCVTGTISYACQEAWLFAGTIRENILFGQPLDVARYDEVVKVCALNQDFKLLPFGDSSIVGDRGITLSGGQKARISLARAIYKKADIYIFDDPLSAVDTSVAKQLFEQCILGFLENKCVILATHQIQYLQKSDKIYLLKHGTIVAEGNYERIRHSGHNFTKLLQKEVEFEDMLDDDAENKTSKQEEKPVLESKNSGTIPIKVYLKYLLSGGWFLFLLILLMFVLSQAVQSGTDYFESYWVNLEETTGYAKLSPETCIYIYSGLVLLVLLVAVVTSMNFYMYFMNTSIKLHDVMFSAIIKAKLQFFFTHSAGSILNRFSKDMGTADTSVPKFLIDTIQNGLHVVFIFLLVAIVNPWMVITSTTLLILFYCIRVVYLASSREVKRIEAISRSPIYAHLTESLHGLEIIRAFDNQEKHKQKFDRFLNDNTAAAHTFLSLNVTFGLWLSLFCSVYVALVTASCFWGRKIYGGDLGLIITQSMSLADLLNWGMIQWSEFENEMTSVERIIEFRDTESEDDSGSGETWPQSSSIQFKEVTLRYKADIPPALDKISFTIAPKEKIGVVGRTGAGKTSIMSTLFRLVEFEGDILVGDVNIKDVSLEVVRSNISIIPQDPVLFSGTVRENLDPFNRFADCDLWAILDDLDLKNFVIQLPQGLESKILEKGANLSVGQRQLFCLARALLRRNNILVFDEATASVDYKTDSLIQSTIKKKLRDCTVLIIAHRLHTIIDCDKVLVLDAGKVVEFDHPHLLLAKQDGALCHLVSKTGSSMKSYLEYIARKNYNQRYENIHF